MASMLPLPVRADGRVADAPGGTAYRAWRIGVSQAIVNQPFIDSRKFKHIWSGADRRVRNAASAILSVAQVDGSAVMAAGRRGPVLKFLGKGRSVGATGLIAMGVVLLAGCAERLEPANAELPVPDALDSTPVAAASSAKPRHACRTVCGS